MKKRLLPSLVQIMVAGFVGLFLLNTGSSAAEPIRIYAASSLAEVLTSLEKTFEAKTGADIRISFAASSVLAHQIERGAPADLFFSANLDWVSYLVEKGFTTRDRTASLAENTLVLIAPKGADAKNYEGLANFDFSAWIRSGERLAIADPGHVPAGIYAKQALLSLDRWDVVADRLAIANNARAALLLVERGEAPLGIVYRSDAKASLKVFVLSALPPATHDPIQYRMAKLGTESSPMTHAFWDYLGGPEAAAVLRENGFIPTAK